MLFGAPGLCLEILEGWDFYTERGEESCYGVLVLFVARIVFARSIPRRSVNQAWPR